MATIPNCPVCGLPIPTKKVTEVRPSCGKITYAVLDVTPKQNYHGLWHHKKCLKGLK